MKKILNSKFFMYGAGFLVALIVLLAVKRQKETPEAIDNYSYDGAPNKSESINTINRKTALFTTTKAPEPQTIIKEIYKDISGPSLPKPAPHQGITDKSNFSVMPEAPLPVAISHYTKPIESEEESAKGDVQPEPLTQFAPFGRLIKCELVNTLESGNLGTPIIGLVTEDIYWNHDLIIPAGSEIHGKAASVTVRDRMISQNQWKVILPNTANAINGATLELNGYALDREDTTGEGRTFGITDGSYGIKGERIKSEQLEELKLFGATFIGAATAGLQEHEPGIIAPGADGIPIALGGEHRIKNTSRDAALGGITAIMERYADILQHQVLENGYFTRVPAGKQFYVYIEQLIDPKTAGVRYQTNNNQSGRES